MNEKAVCFTRDTSELASSASDDAFHWLCDAVSLIDENMGHGYAAKHPAMVAGFMNAAALSFRAERQVDAAEMIALALLELAKERGGHG